MREFVQKKTRNANIFRISLILVAVLWFASFFVIPFIEFEVAYPLVMLLTMSVMTGGIIYLVKYIPLLRSVKFVKEKGLENVIDDITIDRPTLPRSKIYCGQKAFFCQKPCAIIPYAEIAWVHLYERRAYGIVVEKAVIFYTTDGRKFSLKSNFDEINWLIENYIIPNSPDLIIGYDAEKKALYKKLNPQYRNAGNRVKKIWGIVLLCIAAVLLVAMIINFKTAEILPLTILISVLLIIGGLLYMVGNKK